jgi:N-methylhydantoinase B
VSAIDPITFQVIISRLNGIVAEMTDAVFRTGYSTIVRESNDASCTLVDAGGNAVSEYIAMPTHIPCTT